MIGKILVFTVTRLLGLVVTGTERCRLSGSKVRKFYGLSSLPRCDLHRSLLMRLCPLHDLTFVQNVIIRTLLGHFRLSATVRSLECRRYISGFCDQFAFTCNNYWIVLCSDCQDCHPKSLLHITLSEIHMYCRQNLLQHLHITECI